MRQVRRCLDRRSAVFLCNALIISRLDYCNSVLSTSPKTLSDRLQRVMNLAARIIVCAGRTIHITPVLRELCWLPVEKRVRMKIAVLTSKCLRGNAPRYLQSHITVYAPSRDLRSSSDSAVSLVLGTARKTIGRGAWEVASPCVWNSLPSSLRETCMTQSKFQTYICDTLWRELLPL